MLSILSSPPVVGRPLFNLLASLLLFGGRCTYDKMSNAEVHIYAFLELSFFSLSFAEPM